MNTEIMAPRKNKRNEVGRAIAQSIIEQYQPQNAQDMQNAIVQTIFVIRRFTEPMMAI